MKLPWDRLVLIAAVLVLVAGMFFSSGSAQVTTTPNRQRDMAELQKLTGGDVKVAVYLIYNPTVIVGRIKSVPTVLGKNYLQLQTDTTELVLINVDSIAALKQTFN